MIELSSSGKLTHSHLSGVSEQTVFEITSSMVNTINSIWLDFVNLTQDIIIKLYYKSDGTNYREFMTISWDTSNMSKGALITDKISIDDDFKLTLTSVIAEGASRNIPYQYFYEGVGIGATQFVYTLTDSVSGLPIPDADVWVTTDISGSNRIGSGTTNSSGEVTFWLDAGVTLYFWRQKNGYNFANPDTEVVD